jgi:hypothetical protein
LPICVQIIGGYLEDLTTIAFAGFTEPRRCRVMARRSGIGAEVTPGAQQVIRSEEKGSNEPPAQRDFRRFPVVARGSTEALS